MKIQVTEVLPNGQVTQQVLSKEGAEVLRLQAQLGAKISFNVEGDKPADAANVNGKTGNIKKSGNNLVLESEGEHLVEVTDFYSTAGASVGNVGWNYAAADAGLIAVTPEAQALPSDAAVSESGALLPVIAPGWMVIGGAATVANVASGGGSSAVAVAVHEVVVSYSAGAGLGPVVDSNDLSMTLYKADGTLLGTGTYDTVTDKWNYTDITRYSGMVIAVLSDTNAVTADYRDEASNANKDLDSAKLAVFSIDTAVTSTINFSITPLTDLVAKKLAVNIAGAVPGDNSAISIADLSQADAGVAKLFGINTSTTPLWKQTPSFTVDASGVDTSATANAYGLALAALSETEHSTGLSSSALLTDLAAKLDIAGDGSVCLTPGTNVNSLITAVNSVLANVGADAGVENALLQAMLDATTPTVPVVVPQSANENTAMATGNAGAVTMDVDAGSSVVVTFTNGVHTVSKTYVGNGAPIKVQLTAAEVNSLTDGTISVSAVATGIAGNSSSAGTTSFVLNTATAVTVPTSVVNAITAISLDSGTAADFITNQTVQSVTGTFTGTLAGTENIRVSADGGVTWVIASTGAGTWTAANLSLGSGNGQLITQTINASGNTLAGATHSYTLDTVASAPVFTLNSGSIFSGQSVIIGTAEANASVTVTVDPDNNSATANSFAYTALANASGVWTVDLATAVPSTGSASFISGTAKVSATQTDVAGNTSVAANATYTTNAATSYSVVGPTDALGVQLKDANLNVLGVDEGAGNMRFAIVRSGDTSGSGTVTYSTQNGTATAGSDYTTNSGTVTFAAGQTVKIVNVAITNDTLVEANETLSLNLTSATGGSITAASSIATILDNEQSIWSVASVPSVDEGAGSITYTITRTGKSDVAADIHFATAGGTATAGADYTAIADQTVHFNAGDTSKTVIVNITDDNIVETNETVVGAISNASTGSILAANSTTIINDNEQSIWSIVSSGDVIESAGYLTYTINRTGASGAASISFVTVGGTATAGTDYVAADQSVSFAVGEMSKTIQVAVINDALFEANETVIASISVATQGLIATGSAIATIKDDDQTHYAVSANQVSVDEGAGTVSFTITRSGVTSNSGVVEFDLAGTATRGQDYANSVVGATTYSAATGHAVLNFAANELTHVITLNVTDDSFVEQTETVGLQIVSADAGVAVVDTGSASIDISDNEKVHYAISATQPSVREDVGNITYTITRSNALAAGSVDFQLDGTASRGADYTDAVVGTGVTYAGNGTGKVSFAVGQTTATLTVAVTDDLLIEQAETLDIQILNPDNSVGAIDTASASVTVVDNDSVHYAVVADQTTVSEANGIISYTVTRMGNIANAGAVNFSLSGSATRVAALANFDTGSDVTDYSYKSGAASFNHGANAGVINFLAGETSKVITFDLNNDQVGEATENVSLLISTASGAGSIDTAIATVIITDDETAVYSVSAPAASVNEGVGKLVFTIERTGAAATDGTVNFSLGGTAVRAATVGAGVDYAYANGTGTINFAAGQLSKTIELTLNDDQVIEATKTISIAISSPTTTGRTSSLGTASAVVDLLDNDAVTYSIVAAQSGNVLENSAAGTVSYTVMRTGDTSAAGAVDFQLAGKAAVGVDFLNSASVDGVTLTGAAYDTTAHAGVINFAAGEINKTLTLTLMNDTVSEIDKLATVLLSKSSTEIGSSVSANLNSASVNIVDDDVAAWSIATSDVHEDAGYVTFTINRVGNISHATAIQFSTLNGTALPGTYDINTGWSSNADYEGKVQTVSFAAGVASIDVTVKLNDDGAQEPTETLIGAITGIGVVGFEGSITTAVATAHIFDNDTMRWSVTGGQSFNESDGLMYFTVTRTGNTDVEGQIDFATQYGSATAGADYTAVNQRLVFAAGVASMQVAVNITSDTTAEADESVSVQIGNASAGTVDGNAAFNTILDDDHNTWTIARKADVFEGDGYLTYVVTRTGHTSAAGQVQFGIGPYSSVDSSDYTSPTSIATPLQFAANETTKEVYIPISNDITPEGNETLSALLTAVTAGDIVSSKAVIAVIYDDDQTHWNIANTGMADAGGYATLTVVRSGKTNGTATIDLATSSGTAIEGVDFTGADQTLSFADGEVSKSVYVKVGSAPPIAGSTFTASLLQGTQSTGTIDVGATQQSIAPSYTNSWEVAAVADYVYEQNGYVAFTVKRTGDLSSTASINFATSGTATKGTNATNGDYIGADQTLTFAQGVSSTTVLMKVNTDALNEGLETVVGSLSGASIHDTVKVGTANSSIVDTGKTVWRSVQQDGLLENLGLAQIVITRDGDLSHSATIDFDTFSWGGGGLQPSTNFVSGTQVVNFNAGETSKLVYVQTIDNSTFHGNDFFLSRISAPSDGGAIVSGNWVGPGWEGLAVNEDDVLSQVAPDSTLGDDVFDFSASTASLVLSGGVGNDVLKLSATAGGIMIGGIGADTMDGGGGGFSRVYYYNSLEGVTVNLNDSSQNSGGEAYGDVITNVSAITGSEYNDHLTGSNALQGGVMVGRAGDDVISLGDLSGNLATGGAGSDTVYGGASADQIYGDPFGADENGNVEMWTGVSGDDLLMGNGGDDSLYGQLGNDTLIGGSGSDSLTGGSGVDTFVFDALDGSANGGLGRDVMADFVVGQDNLEFDHYFYASTAITSAQLSDYVHVVGTGAAAVLQVDRDGAGTILGWADVASLANGAIDSTTSTAALNQMFTAGELTLGLATPAVSTAPVLQSTNPAANGTGVLETTHPTMTFDVGQILGGVAGKYIHVDYGTGSYQIEATDADHVLISGNTVSLIDNLASGAAYDVTVDAGAFTNLAGNTTAAIATTTWNFTATGSMTGTAGNDTIYTGSGNDTVNAGAGNDTIYGSYGNDTIDGGIGNNIFYAGAGAETYTAGDDKIDFSYSTAAVMIDFSAGWSAAVVSGGYAQGDVYNGAVWTVTGSNYDDVLKAIGGQWLIGGAGNDTFSCAALGSGSIVNFWMQAGADTAVFDHTPVAGAGITWIQDFSVGDGDLIALDHAAFNNFAAGSSVTNANISNTGVATSATTYLLYSQNTGDLAYDADGNGAGAAVVFAHLDWSKPATLDASSFSVI